MTILLHLSIPIGDLRFPEQTHPRGTTRRSSAIKLALVIFDLDYHQSLDHHVSAPMSSLRSAQQIAAASICVAYVGYVAYDRYNSHRETALENARERGRKRAHARLIQEEKERISAASDHKSETDGSSVVR